MGWVCPGKLSSADMKITQTICATALIAGTIGCTHPSGLVVTHIPNPSDVHRAQTTEIPPFPYVWYYRTEVSNATDRPIRITKFEGCFYQDAKWIPANITHRILTADDFSRWYTQGDLVTNGWIQPHTRAACDPNWHGVTSPVSPRCKWTYDGIDPGGRVYHAEAEIKSVPVKNK